MVVFDEDEVVMVKPDGEVREACLQRRKHAEHLNLGSAQAAVLTALELLSQPGCMREDPLRIVGESLWPHAETVAHEAVQ